MIPLFVLSKQAICRQEYAGIVLFEKVFRLFFIQSCLCWSGFAATLKPSIKKIEHLAAVLGIITSCFTLLQAGFKESSISKMSVSAEALALGDSCWNDEDEALKYNPAFLCLIRQPLARVSYGPVSDGVNYSNLYWSGRIKKLYVAASFSDLRSAVDLIDEFGIFSGRSITVSQSEFAVGAGFSIDKMLLGAAVKYDVDSIDSNVQNSASFNAGTGYPVNERLNFGFTVSNLAGPGETSEDKPVMKTTISAMYKPRLGFLASKLNTKNKLYCAVIFADADTTNFALGFESKIVDIVNIRLGLEKAFPSFGIGFDFKPMEINLGASMKDESPAYLASLLMRFYDKENKKDKKNENPSAASEPKKEAKNNLKKAPKPKPEPKRAEKQAEVKASVNDAPEKTQISEAMRKSFELSAAGAVFMDNKNYFKAEEKFKQALTLFKDNAEAQKYLKQISEQKQKAYKQELKNEKTRLALIQSQNAPALRLKFLQSGLLALSDKDYVAAEKNLREVLKYDFENSTAIEGIRQCIEVMNSKLMQYFAKQGYSSEYFGPNPVHEAEALSLSSSGTFPYLAAAVKNLEEKRYKAAYKSWLSVMPRDSQLVHRYSGEFDKLVIDVVNGSIEKAKRFAAAGYYMDAVKELDDSVKYESLQSDVVKQINDLIAAYSARGKFISATYLAEARRLIDSKSIFEASIFLERTLKAGFNASEAEALMGAIKPELVNARSAARKVDVKTLDIMIKKANELIEREKYRDARVYFIEVLSIDPENENARRRLDKLDASLFLNNRQK